MKSLSRITLTCALTTAAALAGEPDLLHPPDHDDHHGSWGSRPDSHAPIGVMGDHVHGAGEFMLSYRYMFMRMEQSYDGSSRVSDSEVLNDFIVTPTNMDMEMHMFGLMYAPTDRLTLMGMLNLVQLSMDHRIGRGPLAGRTFTTESEGLGDSSLTAMYQVWNTGTQRAHFSLGLLLPTAELDEEDFLPPAGGNGRLPYPMQLGHGSWGVAPGITWSGHNRDWSWGAQLGGRFLLSDNDEDYRLGNRGELTVWGARRLNDWLSVSARTAGATWGNITGRDDRIPRTNPAGVPIIPTADPKRRGGSRLDAAVGFNLRHPTSGARLALEVGKPVWHDVDGPQLVTDWWMMAGLQWAW